MIEDVLVWSLGVGFALLLIAVLRIVAQYTKKLQQAALDQQTLSEKLRKTEELLDHERELVNALMNAGRDAIYIKDSQSRFIAVNNGGCRQLEVKSTDDIMGKTDLDFFPPDVARQLLAEEAGIIASGKPVIDRIEMCRSKDGSETWLAVTKAPYYTKDGVAAGIVGFNRDITASKKAEDALSRERDFLKTLMDNIPDQIYFKDVESRFMRINGAVAKVLGLKSPEDAVGKSDIDYFKPEDAHAFQADDKMVIRSGKPLLDRIESAIVSTGELWMSTTKAPIFGKDGQPIGIVGISRDITDRKKAEKALQDIVAGARCILWDAYVARRGDGYNWRMTIHPSDLTREEFGIETGCDGAKWIEHVPAEYRNRMNERSKAALAAGEPGYQQEFPFRAIGGVLRWLKEDVKITPLPNGDFHVVGVCLDITDRKRTELLLENVVTRAKCLLWNAEAEDNGSGENFGWKFHLIASDRSREWLGPPCEDESKNWVDHIVKEDLPEMHRRCDAALRSGAPGYSQEFRMRGIDGVVHWMSESVQITPNGSRQWDLVGVVVDITDRKMMEKQLEVERDLLQALMDNIPDNIYFKDSQLRFIRINQHQSKHVGLENPKLAIGKTDFDFYPAELASEFCKDEEEMIRSGKGLSGKIERQSFNGEPERWTLTSKVPYRGVDGVIQGIVGVSKDITQLKKMERELSQANEQLNKLAREDALTGLLNRRMILDLARNEWARWERYSKPFSILMIDADNFKNINDRFGHLTGDQALRIVSNNLLLTVRSVDVVGRFGGEEFVVILPETGLDGAMSAAHKIVHTIGQADLQINGSKVPLTVSVGVATVMGTDRDLDTILHRADVALYAAKAQGKNRAATVNPKN